MKRVENRRFQQTSLALPGTGIILAPKGQKGDSAHILDREAQEPTLVALVKIGAVSVKPIEGAEPEELPSVAAEVQRIRNTNLAHKRAKDRAQGRANGE